VKPTAANARSRIEIRRRHFAAVPARRVAERGG